MHKALDVHRKRHSLYIIVCIPCKRQRITGALEMIHPQKTNKIVEDILRLKRACLHPAGIEKNLIKPLFLKITKR